MRLRFSQAAETDLAAALLFYESQAEGLGDRLLASVNETCGNLLLFPGAGRAAFSGLRKINIPRFPFGIIYRAEPDLVVILGVIDLRRDPEQIEDEMRRRNGA